MDKIKILDKEFAITITNGKIQETVERMAGMMNNDLKGKDIVFLGILNGAFMFVTDIIRRIELNCEISFVKLATYGGSSSTGCVKVLIGLDERITGKTVVILEDIIDSGMTIDDVLKQLRGYDPKEIIIATLLIKPSRLKTNIKPDYTGFEIPGDFVVGYGLDYRGYGRNLINIYTIIN
jgi:hypoxanthine phosphoribosyltransferase